MLLNIYLVKSFSSIKCNRINNKIFNKFLKRIKYIIMYQSVCPQSILTLAIFSSFWQLNLYMNSDIIKKICWYLFWLAYWLICFFFRLFWKETVIICICNEYVFYIKSRDIWTQLHIIDCIDLSYILLFAKKNPQTKPLNDGSSRQFNRVRVK